MTRTRIAFIGAGSVVFTKNLLGDLLSFPELAGAEIALHDIDANRLATAEAMAHSVAAVLAAIPTIIVFALLQRQFISGLTLGSTKE